MAYTPKHLITELTEVHNDWRDVERHCKLPYFLVSFFLYWHQALISRTADQQAHQLIVWSRNTGADISPAPPVNFIQIEKQGWKNLGIFRKSF